MCTGAHTHPGTRECTGMGRHTHGLGVHRMCTQTLPVTHRNLVADRPLGECGSVMDTVSRERAGVGGKAGEGRASWGQGECRDWPAFGDTKTHSSPTPLWKLSLSLAN